MKLFASILLFFSLLFSNLTAVKVASNSVDDPQEMQAYLMDFPSENYIICDIVDEGRFYAEPDINDVIKTVLRMGIPWESHLVPLIQQYTKPGSTVLDIGAHIGTFTILMAKLAGDNGAVHAFEPQKKIFRELYHNCVLNNVDNVVCHRNAIGDQHQIIQMNPTGSDSEGATHIGVGGDITEMRTLDSYKFRNVSFIKIDVEHSEDQVLDGMINTIKRNRPVIVIELQGGTPWEEASPEIRQKILNSQKKLKVLGYKVQCIQHHDYLALPN